MGRKHVWEGKLRLSPYGEVWLGESGTDANLEMSSELVREKLYGKPVRITVELLENGGGGVEEANQREV